MTHEPFVIERTFKAPVELVWKAITDKDAMKKWYFDLPEFKADVGFEFKFSAGKDMAHQYLHICQVTEVALHKKLAYSWRYDGYAGNSIVTFDLFPEGDETRLRLTHSGLENFAPANNPDLHPENFAEGWTQIIGTSLKAFIEKETGIKSSKMSTQMFVNLPVKDLQKSIAFFTRLGFKFNPQFTDENATCMIINDNSFVMLLVEPFFKTFTKKEIVDAKKATEVLVSISMNSKEKVNDMVNAALAAGGTSYSDPQDHGWMYQRAFADLDGHQWEMVFMDVNAMPKPEKEMTSAAKA